MAVGASSSRAPGESQVGASDAEIQRETLTVGNIAARGDRAREAIEPPSARRWPVRSVGLAMDGAGSGPNARTGWRPGYVESLVNLARALMALWMLTVAAREPDEEHAFGHSKAEIWINCPIWHMAPAAPCSGRHRAK